MVRPLHPGSEALKILALMALDMLLMQAYPAAAAVAAVPAAWGQRWIQGATVRKRCCCCGFSRASSGCCSPASSGGLTLGDQGLSTIPSRVRPLAADNKLHLAVPRHCYGISRT